MATPVTRSRFTIERIRTLVLVGGVVLVAAIGILLIAGRWKLKNVLKDIPGHLGVGIQQSANGVDYTQSRKGKTLFKIHAARAVQMKSGGKTLLHDVHIDLYGEDGTRSDTITGSEFEYDPESGIAHADGTVEISLMRPGVKPAIANLKPGSSMNVPLGSAASAIEDNEIHVRTSGLTFNQKTGLATTEQRVDFRLKQGNGNAIGATYLSTQGSLILDHAVELHADRGASQPDSEPVTVHAAHAEFERANQLCTLTQAVTDYHSTKARTAKAEIHFRDAGSVSSLDGSGGVDIQTQSGVHLTAPKGNVDFDERNHPQTALLEGGTQMDVSQPNRQIHGSAPTAHLVFDGRGQLHRAHLEQGVAFQSKQTSRNAKGAEVQIMRTWNSRVADVDFATVPGPPKKPGASTTQGQSDRVEARTIHGSGNVVVTSETHMGDQILPSRLSADTVVAELGTGNALTGLTGSGHAQFEQKNALGVQQSSCSDQLAVRFSSENASTTPRSTTSEIEAVHQSGHVVLVQQPVNQPGHAKAGPLHATAEIADYDGKTELLHLWGAPRIQSGSPEEGGMEMTANQIDFARATGDAFAHGDVKASWTGSASTSSGKPESTMPGLSGIGSSGPAHAVSAEAEFHQAQQEIVFLAPPTAQQQPRIWQGANSVAAPHIVLNRQKQTLVAYSANVQRPVVTILVNNPPAKQQGVSQGAHRKSGSGGPELIRIRSGDLHYSAAERLAVFHAGSATNVTAETTEPDGEALIQAQEADVLLLPAGSHAGATSRGGVDRMTAIGHVIANWPDRKGTGEKLVYVGDDETFTLTGTSATPPRITDASRGTVTGNALIFHTRDDSVTVEGDGLKTVTETRSKKK